jgi:hypothetical protein
MFQAKYTQNTEKIDDLYMEKSQICEYTGNSAQLCAI